MQKKLMFNCPLDRLYTVKASCNYNMQNSFCPVLVEIKDEVALQMNNNMAYLLQVWNLQGECVFERSLENPVSNWNINGDIFMFQENSEDLDIWIVKLKNNKKAFVYRFRLPPDFQDSEDRIN